MWQTRDYHNNKGAACKCSKGQPVHPVQLDTEWISSGYGKIKRVIYAAENGTAKAVSLISDLGTSWASFLILLIFYFLPSFLGLYTAPDTWLRLSENLLDSFLSWAGIWNRIERLY